MLFQGRLLEQQGKTKGLESSQDQFLGEDTYVDPETQVLYDEEILSLCYKSGLNA